MKVRELGTWLAGRKRAFLAGLGVTLIFSAVGWLGVHAVADGELDAFQTRWAEEVATARARAAAARIPALRGDALDGNAAERYRELSWKLEDRLTLSKKTPTDPTVPLPPRLVELVGKWSHEIAALRSATHAGRCDWAIPYEEPAAGRPDCLGALGLARLLIVDGHVRARDGDAQGAAEAWLDAARFGADWERGWVGPLDVAPAALESLARLLASDRSRELDLARLEAELRRLEDALVPLVDRFAEQRLDVLGRLARAAQVEGGLESELSLRPAPGLASWLPERWVVIHALTELDLAWRDAERAVAAGDVEGWAAADLELQLWKRKKGPKPARIGWNLMLKELSPAPAEWVDHRRLVLTWIAFARTAIALERLPAPRDPAGVKLPANPFEPASPIGLALDPDGTGYALSVVGPARLRCGELHPVEVALRRARAAAPDK